MFNTLSDPFLQVAAWTGLGAMTVTVLMLAQIIHLRLGLVRYRRREQTFQSVWRPLFVQAAAGVAVSTLPQLRRRDELFFLMLWNHFQESVRGQATTELTAIAYRVGSDAIARRLIKRRNRAQKLLGILTLGHMRDAASWDVLIAEAKDEDSATSINALRALVQTDAPAAAQHLTSLMLRRHDWALQRIAGLLQESQQAFSALLLAAIDNQPADLHRTLRLIEALNMPVPTHLLKPLLRADLPADTVIAALRITNSPQLAGEVRGFLAHDDWRVRVQAAKVLGRIGDRTDIGRLAAMLGDREWWVRYRSAQALVGLPFFNQSAFEASHSAELDRYAFDMLEQVIAEKRV